MIERKQYSLELRDTNDDLISVLKDAFDIQYTEVLNGASTLDFKLPIEEGSWWNLDVGSKAIVRGIAYPDSITYINKDNAASADGVISTVKIYAFANLTACKVATFYKTGANDLKCRATETIGTVTAGSEQTFSGLSLTVETGDYIGLYFTAGWIYADAAGFLDVWFLANDHCVVDDDDTYALATDNTMSLYGVGLRTAPAVIKPNEIWLMDYESDPIDVGSAATDRAATKTHSDTLINEANPANTSGILTAVDVFVETELEDCSIGVFYKTAGINTYQCRSAHDAGTVAVGLQTLDVSLAIEEGDYIGIYFSAGEIEADNTGVSTASTIAEGNWCVLDSEHAYVSEANIAISLWGRGVPLIERFRITSQRDIRQSNTQLTTNVTCESFLNQLADEYLALNYTAKEKTVSKIIDDLLALQAITPALTRGLMEPGGVWSLDMAEGDTVLRALLRLRDSVGGYIYVDTEKKLQWLDDIGEDTGQQIRYRKNLIGIERETDYTAIVNRIYAFGEGSGTTRIELDVKQLIYDAGSLTIIHGSENAVVEQTASNTHESLYAGEDTRVGQKITIANEFITSLSFRLAKRLAGGQESADVWFRIRATDDDEILNEKLWGGSGDLATQPTYKWEKAIFDVPVNINEEVYLLVEFEGGSSQRSIYCRKQTTDVAGGEEYTDYDGAYHDNAAHDCAYKYEFTSDETPLRRVGQKLTPDDKDIYKLSFPIAKVGSPTGDVTFTVRKVSDDAIIASKVLCDASELTTTLTWYSAVFLPENVDEEVRISVEFGGGDDDDYIVIPRTDADEVAAQAYTYYSLDADWTDNTDFDTPYIYAWVIQDTTSQGTYDVSPKMLTNTDMADYDSLLAWAALKLTELKDPRVSYRIDTVDLSVHDVVDFSFDALQIGSLIQVIDEDLNIDVNLRVVRIDHLDMLHPERMVVEVSNKVRDITDIITVLAGEV